MVKAQVQMGGKKTLIKKVSGMDLNLARKDEGGVFGSYKPKGGNLKEMADSLLQ